MPTDRSPHLTFLLPGETDLESLRQLDPDRSADRFVLGEHAWILQTYLRLARAGATVELATTPPERGWVVFHAGDRKLVAHLTRGHRDLILVCARGDRHRVWYPDFEVVQNRASAGGNRFFVPHWPQPSLVPRDPGRGARLENVVFVGFETNLDPAFTAPAWRERLATEGLSWRAHSTRYDAFLAGGPAPGWHDYTDVDAVLAVRPPSRSLHRRKPATKLYNAWLAGVPALLGPELAYRELRRSDLDYFEVTTTDDALAALRRLRDEPRLYETVVENGRRRAEDFRPERLVETWHATLAEMDRRWRRRSLLDRAVRRLRIGILHLPGRRTRPA